MTKNGLPNSGEPDDRRPGSMIMGTAKIIDFQRAVAARTRQVEERRAPQAGDLGLFQAEIGSLRHQVDLLSVDVEQARGEQIGACLQLLGEQRHLRELGRERAAVRNVGHLPDERRGV